MPVKYSLFITQLTLLSTYQRLLNMATALQLTHQRGRYYD